MKKTQESNVKSRERKHGEAWCDFTFISLIFLYAFSHMILRLSLLFYSCFLSHDFMFVSLVFFVFSSCFLHVFFHIFFHVILRLSLFFLHAEEKGERTHVSTLSMCQPRVCVVRRIKREYDKRERERHGVLRERERE